MTVLRAIAWVAGALVAFVLLDRVLLRMERRGWINYRRRGLSRGGAAYHTLIMHAIFNPGAENLREAQYAEVEEADESGEPPGPDGGA